jgi:TnpA family transposase
MNFNSKICCTRDGSTGTEYKDVQQNAKIQYHVVMLFWNIGDQNYQFQNDLLTTTVAAVYSYVEGIWRKKIYGNL